MERRLLVVVCLFVVACAALVVALASSNSISLLRKVSPNSEYMPSPEALVGEGREDGGPNSYIQNGNSLPAAGSLPYETCETKGCVQAAATLLSNMDETVSPCDNFYQFACGGFVQNTIIPDDKTQMTTFGMLNDKLDEQVRRLVEEPIKEDEPKVFKLVKNLYQSCMNKSLIESNGLEPMHDVLKMLGGWPVIEGDNWKAEEFTWINSVYRFREHGYSVDYFIDFSVTTDVKNSTYRVIDVDQPALGLSREYLTKGLDEPEVKAYRKYQVELAVLLGAPRATAEKDMLAAIEFERKLANYSLPREERRNVTKLYNPMTIKELQEKWTTIPWLDYINRLLPESVKVEENEIVIVTVPEYLNKFEKLIQETDARTQANYVMWRAAAASVSYMSEAVRKLQLDYTTALTGKGEREPRWKECTAITSASLANAVGSLYVRRYFKEESRLNAMEMVKDIKVSFLDILDEIDWMDSTTKERAREKANTMQTHIGYPSELLNNTKLIELYDGLEMNNRDYLMNVLNLTKFGTEYAYKKLREQVNKTDWISHGRPAVVNAFYAPLENSIQFPAGILQGIFYDNDRPRYMNYGAIGWVIGHEISHGFDDQGRQFDSDGNLYDWWEPTTKEAYLRRTQCVIWQYGNYTATEVGINLNGINTQGENIADNGGIKEAYSAYQAWVKRNKPEPRLPGLKSYSSNQLFWLSAANVWCNKYRKESLKLRILTGVHSPGEFRVRGPFSNMDTFARDFNCPVKSAMNPEHKCAVW
ncbi:Membrane metallo-endopeptidase-like 1 [Orchesella cincta]|uniref:Membrane metallo-endopeptidase-like 1 n=1 Tax=Orchesella cincta TaxID=48709 RepID=A0A1D2MVE1_ORCCI|nr:Membrane metallo-endopeptidase-like 1 [Orchesella cincta]